MSEKKTREDRHEVRSPAPWRPFAELEPWTGAFGDWGFPTRFPRLADELFRDRPKAWAFQPALDVTDDEKRYAITVELPGVKREDVHVELQEGVLTIRGEKTSEREEKKEKRRYTERSYGSFTRSLRLPGDADPDRLDASFRDGVLTITIPRTEEAKPRTIAIKS